MAITLSKNQTISLEKSGGGGLTRVRMGLGWDPVKSGGGGGFFSRIFSGGGEDIDLDASCLLFGADRQVIDTVYFGQLKSRDGAIQHTGDNLTGEGEGDDESIIVQLDRLPSTVDALVFTVNSFRGQTFDSVESAFCRLVDESAGEEIARYDLSQKGQHTGVVMAVVKRTQGGWQMTAIGSTTMGRTVRDLVTDAQQAIPS